jgi:tripartite-type tricarboxylate transporter receptor subunit TctC
MFDRRTPIVAGARLARLALATGVLAVGAALAQGQPAADDFYRGRQLDMVIGYSPGGTYDLYARLVARFLGNYIPGNPTIVPRNMPGAGSRAAVRWVYTVGPKDGTVLATADQSLAVEQAMGDQTLGFDTTKLTYIGNVNVDNNTVTTWHTSGVKTVEDAKKRVVVMGATGGSTSSQYPKAMNALLGTKFKIIIGYPGGNEINLAMERGEVDGRGSNAWEAWKSTRPDWIKDKKINILVQIGLSKAPDLPDVPLLMDLAANDQDRALLKLLSASSTIGRPIFTSPDVPAQRVKLLRDSFDAMVKDPAFLAEAAKANLSINPLAGAELQKIVAEIVATPKPVAARLFQIIGGVGDNRGG